MCSCTLIVRFRLSSAAMRTSDSALSHNIKNVSMAMPRNFGNSGMFLKKTRHFVTRLRGKPARQRMDNVRGGYEWDVEECLEESLCSFAPKDCSNSLVE